MKLPGAILIWWICTALQKCLAKQANSSVRYCWWMSCLVQPGWNFLIRFAILGMSAKFPTMNIGERFNLSGDACSMSSSIWAKLTWCTTISIRITFLWMKRPESLFWLTLAIGAGKMTPHQASVRVMHLLKPE